MKFLGEDIPKLGFGLMLLPTAGDKIDVEQTKTMVDKFLAAGFTYFDTAYAYPGSEEAIKTALVDRYPREKYQLATKLPAWLGAKDAEEAKGMFYTSLERTGAGYFDFYLLHNCGDDRTEVFDKFGLWDFAFEQRAKGLIKHVGFSFHDTAEKLDALLTRHPEAEFVQLQINYADWESPSVQSRKCYETAIGHGKPVIIMEPIKGGLLANPPGKAARILRDAEPDASLSSWALRFAASLDGVITILSGMSNIAQMEDNLATMKDFRPLNNNELLLISHTRDELDKIHSIPCTNCRYCVKGCPRRVAIPGILKALNTLKIYGDLASAKHTYEWETSRGAPASDCVECGQCETACPQHIKIMGELKEATAKLA